MIKLSAKYDENQTICSEVISMIKTIFAVMSRCDLYLRPFGQNVLLINATVNGHTGSCATVL